MAKKQHTIENIVTQNPEQQNKFIENLSESVWFGEIIDNNDPENMGRCKIKIFEKFDELDTELIPWAYPANSSVFAGGESKGFGSFSYPKIGTIVRVKFNNGDIYSPEYFVVERINTKLQAEIKESYENSQVVVYDEDEDMKILYTQKDGLKIWHKGSHITINSKKNILIEHVGSTSKTTFIEGHINSVANDDIIDKAPYIYLDGQNKVDVGHSADDQATRCNALIQLLLQLATMIDAKVPVSPGTAVNIVNSNLASICSKIVWVAP